MTEMITWVKKNKIGDHNFSLFKKFSLQFYFITVIKSIVKIKNVSSYANSFLDLKVKIEFITSEIMKYLEWNVKTLKIKIYASFIVSTNQRVVTAIASI